MRRIVSGDKETAITDAQYKRLLHRFNIKRAGYKYKRSCICENYKTSFTCPGCPFNVFVKWRRIHRPSNYGCIELLDSLKLDHLLFLNLSMDTIKAENKQGLAQARAIYAWLETLERR